MSAIALIDRPARPGNLFAALAAFRAGEPRLFDLGVLMLAAMAPTAFAALVDQREFLGINVWDKPLKFEFALAVYLLTLVLFARLLPAGTRRMRWYRTYVTAVIGAIVLEIAWVGGAAALGTASHFNTTTAGMVLYSIMGPLAVLLTSITAVYAWQIARNPATGLSPAVKEGVVLGLALTLPLTLVTAGTMASMGGRHSRVRAGVRLAPRPRRPAAGTDLRGPVHRLRRLHLRGGTAGAAIPAIPRLSRTLTLG